MRNATILLLLFMAFTPLLGARSGMYTSEERLPDLCAVQGHLFSFVLKPEQFSRALLPNDTLEVFKLGTHVAPKWLAVSRWRLLGVPLERDSGTQTLRLQLSGSSHFRILSVDIRPRICPGEPSPPCGPFSPRLEALFVFPSLPPPRELSSSDRVSLLQLVSPLARLSSLARVLSQEHQLLSKHPENATLPPDAPLVSLTVSCQVWEPVSLDTPPGAVLLQSLFSPQLPWVRRRRQTGPPLSEVLPLPIEIELLATETVEPPTHSSTFLSSSIATSSIPVSSTFLSPSLTTIFPTLLSTFLSSSLTTSSLLVFSTFLSSSMATSSIPISSTFLSSSIATSSIPISSTFLSSSLTTSYIPISSTFLSSSMLTSSRPVLATFLSPTLVTSSIPVASTFLSSLSVANTSLAIISSTSALPSLSSIMSSFTLMLSSLSADISSRPPQVTRSLTTPPSAVLSSTRTVLSSSISSLSSNSTQISPSVSTHSSSQISLISSFVATTVVSSSVPMFSVPVSSVPVSSVPVSSVPVSSVPVSSVLMSSLPISSVPVSSVLMSSLPISSLPMSSLPISSLPVSSLPISSVPMSSVPVSSVPVSSLPISSVPVSSVTAISSSAVSPSSSVASLLYSSVISSSATTITVPLQSTLISSVTSLSSSSSTVESSTQSSVLTRVVTSSLEATPSSSSVVPSSSSVVPSSSLIPSSTLVPSSSSVVLSSSLIPSISSLIPSSTVLLSSSAVSTSPPPNLPVVLSKPLDLLTPFPGVTFRYTIPNDTFYDPEGGPIVLSLASLVGEVPDWLNLSAADSEYQLTMLPPIDSGGTAYYVALVATDSHDQSATDVISILPEMFTYPIHSMRVTIVTNFTIVQEQGISAQLSLSERIASVALTQVRLLGLAAGSTVISVSFPGQETVRECSSLLAIQGRIQHSNGSYTKEFIAAFEPEYPLLPNSRAEGVGTCLSGGTVPTGRPLPTLSGPVSPLSLYLASPILLALLSLSLLLLCCMGICCCYRHSRYGGLSPAEKKAFLKRRPVVMDTDWHLPPKARRATVLPGDLAQIPDEERWLLGHTPDTQPPPPPPRPPEPVDPPPFK